MTRKKIKINLNKITLIFSILLNIILIIVIVFRFFYSKNDYLKDEKYFKADFSIYRSESKKVFEKIFLEKNDSLFNDVFYACYEDIPELAYLVGSTYYLIKKDSSSKQEYEVISSLIKDIYGKAPDINFVK